MKIAARALLLVFFIAVVASPNESTGTVSDLEDGYLERASVKVTRLKTGRTRVAITGKRGEFQFKGLEPGEYTLSVNHPAYSYFASAIDFWIASEKLTRFSTIYLLNHKALQIAICQ